MDLPFIGLLVVIALGLGSVYMLITGRKRIGQVLSGCMFLGLSLDFYVNGFALWLTLLEAAAGIGSLVSAFVQRGEARFRG